jgi:hypothetical protein
MRDDFPGQVKDLLAKRVAQRCSNLGCGKPTSGPQDDPTKAINIGVAAHITAASPDGPRYDSTLTPAERSSPENGIWLCQNCAKLIDNDAVRYPVATVRAWKAEAEHSAGKALEMKAAVLAGRGDLFARLERLMPELLAEMRQDLVGRPLSREFVVYRTGLVYWAKGHELVYHPDEHADLENKLHILKNHGLIREITYNDTPRFLMSEELVAYLGAP